MNWFEQWMGSIAQRMRQRRRERNMRAGVLRKAKVSTFQGTNREHGREGIAARGWGLAAGGFVLFTLAGAAVIALHARQLATTAEPMIHAARRTDALQAALPGAQFNVPAAPGIALDTALGGSLLVASGASLATPVRFDLCTQKLVRVGYSFNDVTRLLAPAPGQQDKATALRSVALAAPGSPDMPKVQVRLDGELLQVDWASTQPARWVSDASYGQVVAGVQGRVSMRDDGWLVWGGQHALRFQRSASAACAQAGQLVVQVVGTDERGGKALVAAYPLSGKPAAMWLQPGAYALGAVAPAALEDQTLFRQLQARGLVRLTASGLIDVVPRDLAAWQAGGEAVQASDLATWGKAASSDADRALIKRLYRLADGEYVRQQIDIFNSERRLLAWRMRPVGAATPVAATVAQTPVRVVTAMPPASARLFADMPQGWANWTRIGQWPHGDKTRAIISVTLAQPAKGGEALELMLAGHVQQITGATLHGQPQDACTGRACPAASSVQVLVLAMAAGARTVDIVADALDIGPLALRGDQQYRHLRVTDGRLDWHTVPGTSRVAAGRSAGNAFDLTLSDRNGTLLWSDGAPTAQAEAAGLAPLLGIRREHASSVAGMLGRLPMARSATLSLDLDMQTASSLALDCVGMRRGQWQGGKCKGGRSAPEGRRGGVVIVDLENGDVLAAAGAGAGAATSANWSEVRDFDQSNPARSPLRLPALQHDGGMHHSPGSTFKIITALGLELAAQRDKQLDALLGGMPLPAINQMAQQRGFAFQTHAPVYPFDARHVRITNYREQALDRRAQDGRLGLAQALTYSLNTWFAWSGELSDRSLFGRAEGGAPGVQALEPGALDAVRPVSAMARKLGFEQALRLDGGLLPPDYAWGQWDALQASSAHIDPIHTRHELRQMAIGLRMQVTPLQMALAAGAIGQGKVIAPRLLLELDGKRSVVPAMPALGVRLDRIRAGMKGVVELGTAAAVFRGMDQVRRGLSGKTGTSPSQQDLATVWFTGYLEPGTLPNQPHRLAIAAFVSHSEASGGEHAAPVVAALLEQLAAQKPEQKGK
jgi:hypothetical protein